MVSIQSNRKIRKKPRPTADGIRRTKDQKTLCPPAPCGLGFLTDRFRPVMEMQQPANDWQQMQQEFFISAQHFCQLYGVRLPDTREETFPFDVAITHTYLRDWLKKEHAGTELMILQDDKHKACLSTSQTYNTGRTLYYIPVKPLFGWLQRPDKKQQARLLLSVFAYLYQKAEIPFFTERSYLHMMYQDTRGWILENEQEYEKEETKQFRKDFRQLFREGKIIRAKLTKPLHLRSLSKRCQGFVPATKADEQLLQVAKGIYQLYQDFPERSILENMLETEQDEDSNEAITAGEYISFVWAVDDFIFENLNENINMYLQEKSSIQEPTAIQYFDIPQQAVHHDLSFENRLFDLLNDLADVLIKVV